MVSVSKNCTSDEKNHLESGSEETVTKYTKSVSEVHAKVKIQVLVGRADVSPGVITVMRLVWGGGRSKTGQFRHGHRLL